MKSKYDSVLKVRKQQLDKAELNLNQARARQIAHEEAFKLANLEYLSMSLPQNGDVHLLRQGLQMLDVARNTKELAKEKLELSNKEMSHYQNLYKQASLEYEKIKYLKTEEIKKIKDELKKMEEKFIDEIAISRHFYGGKDE
ncbi:hypothetical protein DMB92_05730 [Campylobacter sp. MIT 99-7217]|uniref:flagellar export protein FliJ n=1 Tax=Campylobacter sp. MIT 99-7217 TaxID=535091 RepID=UPI00115A0EC2|nr:flagellar export protein FliJ [Campylobacter sp. MIT 99-7217]TQR31881.1 hypothetical protein DMB92_05730 [Campylobacter sp. MIT 99-7217]